MEKEFIPYEQALALKELGFEEPCFAYYVDGELRGINLGIEELGGKEPYYQRFGFHRIHNSDINNSIKDITTAPTYSQSFRWFREKYNYSSYIKEATKDKYRFYIEKFDEKFYNSEILTYEEAELECLKKLIEIVKNK